MCRRKGVNQRAHHLVEYVLIIGIVTVALFAMQTYFKRGVQGILKIVADDMGEQKESYNPEESSRKRQVDAAVNALFAPSLGPDSQKYTFGGWDASTIMNKGSGKIYRALKSNTLLENDSYGVLGESSLQEAPSTKPSSVVPGATSEVKDGVGQKP